jgi:hypothetical protein
MSQDARMRAVIDEAVSRAVAPLQQRVEELEGRLRAVESPPDQAPAETQKRPSGARTARNKGASNEQVSGQATSGQ